MPKGFDSNKKKEIEGDHVLLFMVAFTADARIKIHPPSIVATLTPSIVQVLTHVSVHKIRPGKHNPTRWPEPEPDPNFRPEPDPPKIWVGYGYTRKNMGRVWVWVPDPNNP